MSEISGHISQRPDECYEALFDQWPVNSFTEGCSFGSHTAACASYVLGGIAAPADQPLVIIGEDQHTAALKQEIVDAIDGMSSEQVAQGLLTDLLQSILAKTILANLRNPATMDLLIVFGRKIREASER